MAAQSPQHPYWPYTAERRGERRGSSAPLSAASAGRSDGGRSRDAQLSDDRRPDGGGVGVADGGDEVHPVFLEVEAGRDAPQQARHRIKLAARREVGHVIALESDGEAEVNLAPLIEMPTQVRRRESVGATAQVDAIADDGEADDGSVSTTARADESDGEAEAVLSTSDRSADASAAARVDLNDGASRCDCRRRRSRRWQCEHNGESR